MMDGVERKIFPPKVFTGQLNDDRERLNDRNNGEKRQKRAELVSMAMTPIVIPSDIEPVSPIKKPRRIDVEPQKAKSAPIIAPLITARS